MPATPTDDEIKQAVDVINRVPKGFLPFELFIALAAKITTPTVDLVPVRKNQDGEPEILLIQRPADDPYWPREWHVPGTVIRASDKEGSDFSSGKERVLRDELHGTIRMIGAPQFIGAKFWDVKRGRELEHLFYFETDAADEDVVEGQFFTVNNIPDSTMSHHRVIVSEIAEAFRARLDKQ